ncbi:efflux RND transporter periplasmic adaptor subunit [Mesorhizobium sp. CGMCC 1.15528]|uniref:Efflux RND transporter periplasmic adaptor subunit n=1 Tax=Mesorhizobium zhangyense TaxID=1776730 RepID=A0A7C9R6K6_9HYPH|nr:efflux RND transporter periplasmic adaptor subunit [Mesorhizobium zhangyense]NGN41400.1 efflux RND transporter periplasmic adaptor subunit [Mesorhizobium zhangyense]
MTIRSSHKRYLALAAVVLAVAIVALIKAYGRGNADVTEAAAPVTAQAASLTVAVETVSRDKIASSITATGTVQAWQESIVGSPASGLQLVEVPVSEGDRVTEDQVVAKLDDALLKAQLAEQEAAVQQAHATLEAAENAAARGQKLLASKAISAETAEERATTVKTATAQLAQAQAAANRIAVSLAQTEIRAPFDGAVSTRPAVVGSIVQSGTELMRIIRDGKAEIAVQVPDKDLSRIAVNNEATITDASGNTLSGKVSSIAEKIDATTRLGLVYVSPEDNSGLKSGMFARVSITTSSTDSLNVAESALIWRDGKPNVFIVGEDGKVTALSIETGNHRDGRVAVTNGLAGGESVVVSGAGFLNDGNLVRVAVIDGEQTASNTGTAQ